MHDDPLLKEDKIIEQIEEQEEKDSDKEESENEKEEEEGPVEMQFSHKNMKG